MCVPVSRLTGSRVIIIFILFIFAALFVALSANIAKKYLVCILHITSRKTCSCVDLIIEMWNCRHELNSGVARIFPISAGIPGVPIWLLVISWCRCLNFLLTYRRRNGCNCLKHNYHYGMTRADFINRFKKHINIDGKNQVAHADAALVNVFINRYIVNSTLIMKCFNLILMLKHWTCAELTLIFIDYVRSNSLYQISGARFIKRSTHVVTLRPS